jgi:DNA-binding transcriptional ArsR family regulator
MPAPDELAVEFVVDDLELLKVIAHGTRLDILQRLKLPKTVKVIARQLNLPATKLYYHVNLMEKHGLIQVVETNLVSGIVEKKYQVVARNYRIDNQLLADQATASEELDRMLSAIFDVTRSEIQRTVRQTKQNPFRDDESGGILWRSTLRLTAEQYKEFYNRLQTLLDEIEALPKETKDDLAKDIYGLTVAYYPVILPDEGNK